MNSIPQTASIRIVPRGLLVTNQQMRNSLGFTPETRAKRREGDINGFSKASRLRLRRIAASIVPKDASLEVWGCCLTIPGKPLPQEKASAIWLRWQRNNCRRSFKDMPFLWRVELQKRKQAHWHLVCFCKKGKEGALQRMQFADEWRHLIRATLKDGNCLPWTEKTDYGFEVHGVRWQKLTRGQGCVDYLAPQLDHQSKHKQEQLGWQGRQWGIIHRDLVDFQYGERVDIQGEPVKRIIARFKNAQERRRALGKEYVGAGVGEHWRLPSVLFGRDAETLKRIVDDELFHEEQNV